MGKAAAAINMSCRHNNTVIESFKGKAACQAGGNVTLPALQAQACGQNPKVAGLQVQLTPAAGYQKPNTWGNIHEHMGQYIWHIAC
jgi:hypothetical protein